LQTEHTTVQKVTDRIDQQTMRFTGSIFALLAGSAVGFAPLNGNGGPAAFGVTKNRSTALNSIFEVIIGTGHGDGGGAETVKLTLTDISGTTHTVTPGENGYGRGAIDINEAIDFPDINEPVKFTIECSDNWSFGGLWVTNLETGRCYYRVEPGPGRKINPSDKCELALTQITERFNDWEYPAYEVDITTDSDATGDEVWCKIIDKDGQATRIFNPSKTQSYTTASCTTAAESGYKMTMRDAQYILLGKYGSDEWNPTRVRVQGLAEPGGYATRDGPVMVFYPQGSFNMDNNNWRWIERN